MYYFVPQPLPKKGKIKTERVARVQNAARGEFVFSRSTCSLHCFQLFLSAIYTTPLIASLKKRYFAISRFPGKTAVIKYSVRKTLKTLHSSLTNRN